MKEHSFETGALISAEQRRDEEYLSFLHYVNIGDLCDNLVAKGVDEEGLVGMAKHYEVSHFGMRPGTRGYRIERIADNLLCAAIGGAVGYGFGWLFSQIPGVEGYKEILAKTIGTIFGAVWLPLRMSNPTEDEEGNDCYSGGGLRHMEREYDLFEELIATYPKQMKEILASSESR